MLRRTFVKTLSCGAALLLFSSWKLKHCPLRFGVVTDCHYAHKEMHVNRFYSDSVAKMKQAISVFNNSNLDFIIELGDLKDMGNRNFLTSDGTQVTRSQEELESEALGFLDEIEAEFQKFEGSAYHVLGNHDMDCISKQQFLEHTTNPGTAKGKAFYAFEKKGVKLIVLDGNFNQDRTPYGKGNFDWRIAYVSDEQLYWLEKQLKRANKPVIVFCHQLADYFSGVDKSLYLSNAQNVVSLLEQSKKVLAVIQGHHHSGHYSYRNGIHYWTMKGMIESAFPEHNSFAIVEVNQRGDLRIEGYADCEERELKYLDNF